MHTCPFWQGFYGNPVQLDIFGTPGKFAIDAEYLAAEMRFFETEWQKTVAEVRK